MPNIGGTNINWDETKPAGGDSLSIGDEQIRSDKSALRSVIAAEHNFDAGGGANTGYHVLGSARPYYGPQSNVSSTGSDGRLMLTSDTSRLFGVGSDGTVFYGGATAISAGSYPGSVPQRHHWVIEFGQGVTDASGNGSVIFPNSGFSSAPFVFLSAITTVPSLVQIFTQNNQLFTMKSFKTTGVAASSISFYWLSIGTRVL